MGLVLLAQDAAAGGTADGQPQPGLLDGLMSMLPIFIIIYLIFWVIVIRPQSKERKARATKLSLVKKGDRVVTRGGILGKVSKVSDTEVVLQLGTDSKLLVTFVKDAVEDVLSGEAAK